MLASFKNSKMYPLVQRALRVLQFLSALTSLIVFSIRVRKLSKLAGQLSNANGAVEGIVAAAVAYTLGVMIVTFLLKGAHGATSNMLRWFLVIMDVLFIGAFIAVAVLTSPKNGRAGPCRNQLRQGQDTGGAQGDLGCKLPLGTFVTAIVSTFLHFLTALFQNIREKRREHVERHHVKGTDNYAMNDGRDSTTLHPGRESTTVGGHHKNTVPVTGHHNTGSPYNNGSNAV